MPNKATLLATAIAALVILPAEASATLLTLTGVNDSSITASVDFTYNAATSTVGLSVSNTSILYDPILTSLAFNAPDLVSGITSFAASGDLDASSWEAIFDPNSINTPGKFGLFDVGALTGPSFNGGFPNAGIHTGGTGFFQITLAGVGLDTLTEDSFLSLFSAPDSNNFTPTNFITRYQATGYNGEGSDVAVVTSSTGGGSTSGGSTSGGSTSGGSTTTSGGTPVSEPASLAFIGLAMAAFGLSRRRRATA